MLARPPVVRGAGDLARRAGTHAGAWALKHRHPEGQPKGRKKFRAIPRPTTP
jgi:hypothetical protein